MIALHSFKLMGCGISAAVSGLDWYLVSLEQNSVNTTESRSAKVQPVHFTSCKVGKLSDESARVEVQFNDGISNSCVEGLPDEGRDSYNRLYSLSK